MKSRHTSLSFEEAKRISVKIDESKNEKNQPNPKSHISTRKSKSASSIQPTRFSKLNQTFEIENEINELKKEEFSNSADEEIFSILYHRELDNFSEIIKNEQSEDVYIPSPRFRREFMIDEKEHIDRCSNPNIFD